MPAADETRYNLKRLHKAFALASVLLLGATIWLLVEDHHREWKRFQRKATDVELRVAEWRKYEHETDEATEERQRLQERLTAAEAEGLDMALVEQFRAVVSEEAERRDVVFDFATFDRDRDRLKEARAQAADNEQAADAVRTARRDLLEQVREITSKSEFRESNKLDEHRAKSVELEAAKARVGLAVRDRTSQKELGRRQQVVDRLKEQLRSLTLEHQALVEHQTALQEIIERLTAKEEAARKALADNRAALDRLAATMVESRSTYVNRDHGFPLPGKKLLEMPIFDAFNSPLKIENLWAEGLTQDYNFREVRRFDRCTTCHQGIQKSAPGSADRPAYPVDSMLRFSMNPVADDEDESRDEIDLRPPQLVVEEIFGLRIAAEGLIDPNDITVNYVRPQSLAAQAELAAEPPVLKTSDEILDGLLARGATQDAPEAPPGLRMGDVLVAIDNEPASGPEEAVDRLFDTWSEAKRLKSAGKEDEIDPIALTIRRGLPHPCASHPHLDLYVGSLSPHKMSEFACTVCHEGEGSATAFKWASHTPSSDADRKEWRRKYGWFDNHDWLYPMYPQRFVESACLKCHHDVAQLRPSDRYPSEVAPKLARGYNLVRMYGCFGCHEIHGYEGNRRIGPDMRVEPNALTAAQNDTKHPGRLRKPGPSLRFIGHKTSGDFLYDWIRNPRHFRPDTRMPRAFGLWRHLKHEKNRRLAEEYEPVEVQGIVAFLESRTQDFSYLEKPAGLTDSTHEEKAARGKSLFETRGCLVCHDHKDFPNVTAFRDEGEIVEGPDLSAIGDVLNDAAGRRWLYTWIKRPALYDARSVMPDMDLGPIEQKDAQGEVVARTDPVEDMVEYLLQGSVSGYEPAATPPMDLDTLDRLVLEHLSDAFHEMKAVDYVRKGIPERLRAGLKMAETELVVEDADFDNDMALTREQKLRYVGRKSIIQYGCCGCHAIPDFEDAKPIGTGLADWGSKDTDQLAFEHVVEYLQTEVASSGEGEVDADFSEQARGPREIPSGYYMRQILSGNRIGFAYQKLTEPRSFDYHKVENKGYNERLRMPQFPFSMDQREAIMTFVLGLVARPPTEKYVYRPDPRRKAIIEGRTLLDRYRCGGCHVLEAAKWHISYSPGSFDEQRRKPNFPFAAHEFSTAELDTSAVADHLGMLHATLEGMPLIADDGSPMVFDDYGDELFEDEEYDPRLLEYAFQLWKPAALEGQGYTVGESPLSVLSNWISEKEPSDGGFLAKYLLPRVVKTEKGVNPNATGSQAWGWLPPPLLGLGEKAQPTWLHDYLLDPETIRPAVVLNMPRFELSSEEATTLANYFAAVDRVDYPHQFNTQRRSTHLANAEAQYQSHLEELSTPEAPLSGNRFDDAMRLMTDKNYCVTCHIIGDFDPQTSDRAKGPDLSVIYRRMRPEYVRKWIAKPVSVRPYTGMPVNIPYDSAKEHMGGVDQKLYHGTSVEQLEATVDLLLNFDEYAKRHSRITPLVKAAASAASAGDASGSADDGT